MVVGNGMLAKAFSSYIKNENVVIYAAGVSNSSENFEENFQRELKLLEKCIKENANKLIIYFSTCSVNDETLKETKYVQHKSAIESYIKENVGSFIIFRLPIVIGDTKNSFTLFNFLKEKLLLNQEIFIQKNAYRYLVDIDDVSNILTQLIDSNLFLNSIIDVSFSERISVLEITNIMKKEMSSKSTINIIDGGGSYDVEDQKLKNFISNFDIMFSEKYNEKLLIKYLKKQLKND